MCFWVAISDITLSGAVEPCRDVDHGQLWEKKVSVSKFQVSDNCLTFS